MISLTWKEKRTFVERFQLLASQIPPGGLLCHAEGECFYVCFDPEGIFEVIRLDPEEVNYA
jgi:hypothetical protein